jgi:hypothetical protein
MALLLGDLEIRSTTDLQKSTKDVLDAASEHTVIIRREEQQEDIALVKHALVRRAFVAYELSDLLSGACRYVFARLGRHAGDIAEAGYPLELEWVREFDNDDLIDFIEELSSAYNRVVRGDRPVSDVSDIIEQWRRSAMVLRDDALRTRLEQERSIILEGKP